MAHKSTDMRPNQHVFVIFLGKGGCGKSTAFNRITNPSTHRKLVRCCPCNTGVSRNKNSNLHIVDPDTNGCSLHYGLTYSELNSICVFIEFHPRISSTLVDSFWESFSKLKDDNLDMVVVVITKMDYFSPGGPWPTRQHVEKDIRKLFKEDVGIDRVVFWHHKMEKEELFDAIYNEAVGMPLRQLCYYDTELMKHFGILRKTCTSKRDELGKNSTSNLDDFADPRRKKVAKRSSSDAVTSMKQYNSGFSPAAQWGNKMFIEMKPESLSEEHRERGKKYSPFVEESHENVKLIHPSDNSMWCPRNGERLIRIDDKSMPTRSLSHQAPASNDSNAKQSIYEDNEVEENEKCCIFSCIGWRSNK